MSLYQDLLALGVTMTHHESDLYFPDTWETTEILKKYPLEHGNATKFICRFGDDHVGKPYYDVPFAYLPFWDSKTK